MTPLVSKHIIPVTISMELVMPSLGTQGRMLVLLDLGCIRCVVSPEVVVKLELRLKQLKVPIDFCQLDGTVAGERGSWENFYNWASGNKNGKAQRDFEFYSVTKDGEMLPAWTFMAPEMEPLCELEERDLKYQAQSSQKRERDPNTQKQENQRTEGVGAVTQVHPKTKSRIPKEYWDLQEVFSEGLQCAPTSSPHWL